MSTNCFKGYSAEQLVDVYKKRRAFMFLEIWDEDGYFVESCRPPKELVKLFADAGVGISSVHAPFSNWSDSAQYEFFERFKRSCDKAKIFEARYIVVHPVVSTSEQPSEGSSLTCAMPKSFAIWRQLVEVASGFGLDVAFENLGISPQWPTGCRVETVLEIVDTLGMGNVGMCLDFSHCFALGNDVVQTIGNHGMEKTLGIHASDGIYADLADQHLIPGLGELDWDATFRALKEQAFDGHINLEVKGLSEAPGAIEDVFALLSGAYEKASS